MKIIKSVIDTYLEEAYCECGQSIRPEQYTTFQYICTKCGKKQSSPYDYPRIIHKVRHVEGIRDEGDLTEDAGNDTRI